MTGDAMNPNYLSDLDFEARLAKVGGLVNGFFPNRAPILRRGFFSIGNGWLGIVANLIDQCIALGWDRQLCQCKEKFGGLRFYINSASNEVHDAITTAERLAAVTCDNCGESGTLRGSGWMITSCDKCAKPGALPSEGPTT